MCKHFKLSTIIIILTLLILSAYNARGDCICGDANSDTTVNVSDAVHIVNYVFVGGDPPDPIESGDCNCDGTCNVSDAVWIINYIFVGGNEPCDTDGDGNPNCDPNCPSTVTDIDGNVYQTIKIGDQCWMAENLKVTHYRNGDLIPNVTGQSAWENLSTGAYCNFDNDEANVLVYGRLYNWYAIGDSRNIAPEGWHVPTDEEWKQLEMYLGMSQADADASGWRGTDEGGKLKEAGTTHWWAPNTGATNESGFTALPAGYRLELFGLFIKIYENAFFWLSTEYDINNAWMRNLHYTISEIGRFTNNKRGGLSVRCIKD